jgi:hypothetical protein
VRRRHRRTVSGRVIGTGVNGVDCPTFGGPAPFPELFAK